MGLSGTYSGYNEPGLVNLVKEFPPRLKQAIVGAAQHNLLRRGTWNGCVFNAAGDEVGQHISTYAGGAEVFGIEHSLVAKFIQYWDNMEGSDTECNLRLIRAIKDVGLFSEPTTGPLAKRASAIRGYVVKQVFKSELDKLNEEFQVLAQNVDISRPTDQHSQLERDICELVSAL